MSNRHRPCMSNTMATAQNPDPEHPIIAWAGIVAVLAAALLILWARVEVHGTRDLESALSAQPSQGASRQTDSKEVASEVDDAVATGRWAAGFSP
jgi:hypothetical protein